MVALLSHAGKINFEISNLRFEIACAKKVDEGREKRSTNTLRGTLL
jgi:hypothetical protein